MSAAPENNFLKEWEESRSSIKTLDERLHDIRKYGFTFITAFLTASTILFQTYSVAPSVGFEGVPFPETFKAAILGVTLLLILGLFILDRNYRVVQTAIRDRLLVLEKLLNIEVSDVITQRYRMGAVQSLMTFIYVFFVVGDLALGWVVLTKDFVNLVILMIAGATVLVTILALSIDVVVLNYRYGMVDWVIDKLECKQGESVRIIMTNLGIKDFPNDPLPRKVEMWKLVRQCDAAGLTKNPNGTVKTIEEAKVCRHGDLCQNFQLSPCHNFIWIMSTEEKAGEKLLEPDVYCLYRRVVKSVNFFKIEEWKPLARKLIVVTKPKEPLLAHEVTLKTPQPTVHQIIKK